MDRDAFELLAGYNGWANRRLYGCAADLAEEERRADRGLFFRSIHATLNHILAADRIWMKRFSGTGEAPDRLDAVLFEDFPDLRAAREAEDERIADWIAALDQSRLAHNFTYRPVAGPPDVSEPLAPVLLHVFNHQTHHRGQCHGALTGFGREVPPLDLMWFLRERRTQA